MNYTKMFQGLRINVLLQNDIKFSIGDIFIYLSNFLVASRKFLKFLKGLELLKYSYSCMIKYAAQKLFSVPLLHTLTFLQMQPSLQKLVFNTTKKNHIYMVLLFSLKTSKPL